jgi:hypothetical protein
MRRRDFHPAIAFRALAIDLKGIVIDSADVPIAVGVALDVCHYVELLNERSTVDEIEGGLVLYGHGCGFPQ